MTDLVAPRPLGIAIGQGPHYAWVVASVAFLAMLAAAAAAGAPSVLILPLQHEFGWDIAAISTALTARWILFGVTGLLAAALINGLGLRRVVLSALALIAAGLLASLAMTRVWHLVLLWGVLVGIGGGLVALVLGVTVATRWFSERRGLVIGLLGSATIAGQMIVLPALAALVDAYGWRACVVVLSGLVGLAAAAVFALVPERPEDVGMRPYGERTSGPTMVGSAGSGDTLPALREALGSGLFWALLGTFIVCGASTGGIVQTHLVPLCADYGIWPLQATSLLAVMGLFTIVGASASGWLSERFDAGWLLFWFYGLRGLSLFVLPFTDFSLVSLSLFAAFYGLDWIATVPPTARLVTARFGRERANLVFGWVFVGHQLGAAAAASGAGLVRSDLSSYLLALLVTGALCLIASAAILILSPTQRSHRA